MLVVFIWNVVLGFLFALVGAAGWGILSPYFGMQPLDLWQIVGLTAIAFSLRYFLAPRVTNVTVPTPMMMPKFTPAEMKRLVDSLKAGKSE